MPVLKPRVQLKKLQINLPVEIFKEGKYIIARTPVLDFSVQGKTEEEVRTRFTQGVLIFFQELVDLGTLDEFLHDMGWRKIDNNWQSPATSVEVRPVQVDVPCLA